MVLVRSKILILCGVALCAATIFAVTRHQPAASSGELRPDPGPLGSSPDVMATPQSERSKVPVNAGPAVSNTSAQASAPAMPLAGKPRVASATGNDLGATGAAPKTTAGRPAQPTLSAINPPAATAPIAATISSSSFSSTATGSTGETSNGSDSPQAAQEDGGANPPAAGAASTAASEQPNIPVPAGAIVPAILYDTEPKTPQQQAAVEQVIKEFEKNIAEVPSGSTEGEVWDISREIADERYITLFGFEKFNQMHLSAAKEALKERKVTTP